MNNIGDTIKNRRKDLGVSQQKLCKGITSQSTVSRIENGDIGISFGEFIQIADRLNLSLEDVYMSQERMVKEWMIEELNRARDNYDFDRIKELIHSKSANFWSSTLELKIYYRWHLALSLKEDNYQSKAILMIDQAIKDLAHTQHLKDILVEILHAKACIVDSRDSAQLKLFQAARSTYYDKQCNNFKILIKTILNTAQVFSQMNAYLNMCACANEVIRLCHENNSMYCLSRAIELKIYALYYMDRKGEGNELLLQSQFIFNIEKRTDALNKLKKLFKNE